jgi:hypothetical protein
MAKAAKIFGTVDPRNGKRFDGQRLYVGFAAVAAIDRLTSLFIQVEFVPGLAPEPRKAFQGQVDSLLLDNDSLVYGTAGVSMKF